MRPPKKPEFQDEQARKSMIKVNIAELHTYSAFYYLTAFEI